MGIWLFLCFSVFFSVFLLAYDDSVAMSWMPPTRNPQAFQTAYATGTLSGMLGADDVWVGGTMRARGQKLGLIAEDPGEWSLVGRVVYRSLFSGRSASVC